MQFGTLRYCAITMGQWGFCITAEYRTVRYSASHGSIGEHHVNTPCGEAQVSRLWASMHSEVQCRTEIAQCDTVQSNIAMHQSSVAEENAVCVVAHSVQ
jgi:hypothetical protein